MMAAQREHRVRGSGPQTPVGQPQKADAPANQLQQALRDTVRPFADVISSDPVPDVATFNLIFAYQPAGGEAQTGTVRSQRYMTSRGADLTDRPPFVIREGETFPYLAQSWVENPGTVILENLTGTGRPTKPSPEEDTADFATELHVIRPGSMQPIAIVRRGVPYVGEAPDPQELVLLAVGGDVKVRVAVLPK